MRRQDFHFDLPEALIAQAPLAERSGSRLLLLDGSSGSIEHLGFEVLPQQLQAGDLLVFNDTRVIPARLFGHKESGGKVEVLIERIESAGEVLAQIRASKSPRPGDRLLLGTDRDAGFEVSMVAREADLFRLRFPDERDTMDWLESYGHVPLPPYIERGDAEADRERYQTVYARESGAVAAPTAGLHFDDALLDACARAGVAQAFVTLHVGAGTFAPMRVDDVDAHRMHAERYRLPPETARAIADCRARGGRVIAVGTTVVRTLEAAARDHGVEHGSPRACSGETDIFLRGDVRFAVVDGLVTNFHLPESTLLMLVAAFAGREHVLAAYESAVAHQYRFFSYGDAMLVWPRLQAIDPETRGVP